MKRYILLAAAFAFNSSAAQADDAADCTRALQAPDAAIQACTRLLEGASGDRAGKILILRSRAYAETKQFDAALADAAQAATLLPNSVSPIFARGLVHADMKEYDLEVADYTEALKREPQNYAALANRCGARARSTHDASEALEDCNAAAARNQSPTPDLVNRGFVYLRLGRFKDALADYDALIGNNLASAFSYYGRGIARLRLGDADGGKADIAKAISMKSDIADYFRPYGLVP